jgi:hypothetical protein
MKALVAALFLTSALAAQTTITVSRATSPLSSAPPSQPAPPSSSASGGSSANAPSSPTSGPDTIGNSTTFAEIPGQNKHRKATAIPESLRGNNSADGDTGLGAAVNKLHEENAAASAPTKPSGLHFDDLADGTDPVSVTVRHFQMFCNSHNMAQDEAEVRQWTKANQNVVASSPSEMQRKQQYPLVRDQLIGMKFPKEWFDGGTGASPVQKPASGLAAPATSK